VKANKKLYKLFLSSKNITMAQFTALTGVELADLLQQAQMTK
jgi:hypothetical protein